MWTLIKDKYNPLTHLLALCPGTKSQSFRFLHGIRALALLWVLGMHTTFLACLRGINILGPGGVDAYGITNDEPAHSWLTDWSTQPNANGDAGVDLFFCLSGFLIAHMWLREVSKTGTFYYIRFLVRRFLRIWPMLAIALALQVFRFYIKQQDNECSTHWWSVLIFVQNYMPSTCLAQAWSVSTEFQFYLISPFIMMAAYSSTSEKPRRWGYFGLWAGSLIGVIINVIIFLTRGTDGFATYGSWPSPLSYYFVLTRSSPYLAGMAAALSIHETNRAKQTVLSSLSQYNDDSNEQRDDGKTHPWTMYVDLMSLTTVLLLSYCGVGSNRWIQMKIPVFNIVLQIAGRWALGVSLSRIIIAIFGDRLRSVKWMLSFDIWVPIAGLSYSAYLLQEWGLILSPSWHSAGVITVWACMGTFILSFIVTTAVSLAMALPFYVLIEAPISKLWSNESSKT